MAGNYVRVGVGVKDNASGELDRIKGKFTALQKQGAKGIGVGIAAGATVAAIGAIGSAIDGVTDAIGDSVAAASDQREAMSLNSQVFKDAADDVEAWSSTTADAFGESKTSAINFAAGFGNVMKSAGIGMDELAAKSMELTHRAADIGSAFNATGEEVATAMKSGLVGEAEPLRRFGVLLSAAAVEAKALQMGLAKTKGELTEGQKVLARYALIMEQTSESAGMFGRDTDSLADKQKKINARFDDASAAIGTKLLPLVTDLAEGFLDLTDALSGASTKNIASLEAETAALIGQKGSLEDTQKVLDEVLRAKKEASDSLFTSGLDHANLDKTIALLEDYRDGLYDTIPASEMLKGKAEDDMYAVEVAVGDVGEAAGDMADEVKTSTRKSGDYFTQMREVIVDETEEMIDKAFDPLEEKLDEQEGHFRVLAAVEARESAKGKEAVVDANSDIINALDDQASNLVKLGKRHKLTAKEIDKYEADVKKSYRAMGKTIPPEIQKVISKLRTLAGFNGKSTTYTVRINANQSKGAPKATGGTVVKGEQYTVGEHGEEQFIPDSNGRIVPNHSLGKGGGMVVNNYLTVTGNLVAGSQSEVLRTMQRMQSITRWG